MSHNRFRLTICWVPLAAFALYAAGCDGGGDDGTVVPPPQCVVVADCDSRLKASGFVPGCTTVACNAGVCEFSGAEKQGQPCDDGQGCTENDVCVVRQCVGVARTCNDGDPCTTDRCDGPTGECVFAVASGNSCDDGIDCTSNDRCDVDGLCHGAPTDTCECQDDFDCDAALSVDLCDGPLGCTADYRCEIVAENRVVCDASGDSTCLEAVCQPDTGGCELTARSEGLACDSTSNPCVSEGTCSSGACVGPPRDCSDGNPCTLDSCDATLAPGEVCVHLPTGGTCNDGDPCTVNDFCQDGACEGSAKPCDDQNACTADTCDAETGQCLHANVLGPCDDGVPCTADDVCGSVTLEGSAESQPNGVCAGTPVACDDGNVCTSDTCLNAAGNALCQHLPLPGPCDDGDACSVNDFCLGGVCSAGAMVCECEGDADCDAITLSDPCPGERACEDSVFPHVCTVIPGSEVVCEQPAAPCQVATCAPTTGVCETKPLADGKPCDDGDGCTIGSLCVDTVCVAQALVDCDDADDCTSNVCEDGACLSVPLDQGGVLLAADFDSGLPAGWTATTTSQSAAAWAVSTDYTPNASGLGVVATGIGGQYGGPVEATLTSPEFIPRGANVALDLMTRVQVAQPGCGTDKLVVAASSYGQVVPLLQVCATEANWTLHQLDLKDFRDRPTRLVFSFQADAVTNAGFGAAIDDVLVEGEYLCSDGDACTTQDRCALGACKGAPTLCDDNDPCTKDSCDHLTGSCVFSAAACACTLDSDCPSAGPCVSRACGAGGVCVDTPITGPCNDGSVCTQGDTCSQGACVGSPVSCADADPCTTDSCDPVSGCAHAPADGPSCNDGDACTTADACVAGVCVGVPKSCDVGSECTVGQCIAGACQFSALHDGQKVYEAKFDSVGPGKLPAGFVLGAGSPEYSWATATGQAVSGPNALASVLPQTWSAALLSVRSPSFLVPDDGGTLSVAVSAVLSSSSCSVDVLRLLIDGDVVAEVCDDTSGFEILEVDLHAYAGQSVDVSFELTLGAGSAGSADVRLDNLKVTGRYLCDDAQTCTANDACVLGACQGTAIPNCQ
ncbi:MAG: hypothetical protein R3F39_13665 [Myxococcota bacterium]